MKKCPFCGAEIEENARFCLFCMTSFEEKEKVSGIKKKDKRWLVFSAAVLAFTVILLLCFFMQPSPSEDKEGTADSSTPSLVVTPSSSSSPTELTESDTPSVAPTPGTTPSAKPSSSSATEKPTVIPSAPSSSTPSESKTEETATYSYIYRDARLGDDFETASNLENCVVITGVEGYSKSGEYIIPNELGGKRVIAVCALAFSDNKVAPTVKRVIVGERVVNIWAKAFFNCNKLTDIYFCGESIYVEANAFGNPNPALTIHCSKTCHDRNLNKYMNSAKNYGARFEEWYK